MHRQIGILLKKLASGVARSIQKGLCVTVSMDYRELTTELIVLSFYTLRLLEYTEGCMRYCLNGLQRTYYSIDHSVVLHASTTIYRTRAATKIVQRTFSVHRYVEAGMSMGRSSKAAHSDMKPQNIGPQSQA